MSDESKRRKDEMDEFWDIGRLVPQKKQPSGAATRKPKRITPVTISKRPEQSAVDVNGEDRLTFRPIAVAKPAAPSPIFAEYSNFSSFLTKVTVVNWKSSYDYYEFFCKQAAALHKKRGEDCPETTPVPFFSYVAQYSQLSRRQLEWYLWWRECVRNGRYLKTDVSYIYLLSFELINLGNSIDTRQSLDLLIGLWQNYREDYPQLNSTLGEWICDYSLIYNLPIAFPDERIGIELLSRSALPEAFYNFDIQNQTLFAKLLFSFCCTHNYKKSKFYTSENKEIYDLHIPGAVYHLLGHIDLALIPPKLPKKVVSRMSFTGALCSYKAKKHIEIEYASLCDSQEIKAKIGDIVKYAENKVRAHLGIRSRLGIREIDPRSASIIDEYFAQKLSAGDGIKAPDYEKLYDATETEFSFESARSIERHSWEITKRLVEAFEDDQVDSPSAPIPVSNRAEPISETDSEQERFFKRITAHRAFFSFVLKNRAEEQIAYAKEAGLLPEAIVDAINEAAFDCFGDILIEEANVGYCIIDEYRSMFE